MLRPDAGFAQAVPPHREWLAFQTDHFNVTFPAGLEPLARRAAARAEWAHGLLSREFVPPPDGRIELLVTDHVDYSNGQATAFPRNRITLYAQPPAAEPTLAYSDDWLGLLTLHELVHIFHLDDASGMWTHLRTVFGRDATIFPQVYTPGWMVEGLATYYESRLTSAGRAKGSIFDMMLRASILGDDFFTIDRATFDPVRWPTGNTRYLYGSLFLTYLADRHGDDAVSRFVRQFGGQLIPYRLQAAARRTFGATLTREWTLWEDSLRATYDALADTIRAAGQTTPELLTSGGRFAAYPRLSEGGSRLVYAMNNGREDIGHEILSIGGERIDLRRRSALGPASWMPGSFDLLFAQVDFVDPYTLRSDLYLEDDRGEVRRVTRDARVTEPDPHPTAPIAVAVQSGEGANGLVLVELATGDVQPLVEPVFERYWSNPRWSPEGDRIAAALWREGGRVDVVVIDTTGTILQDVTASGTIDSDPEWSPDGRYVLFSSDVGGVANLFAKDLEAGTYWQVTNVLTGAFQPDVSEDATSIVFAYYLSDGYHIARIPYDPASWREVSAELFAESVADAREGGTVGEVDFSEEPDSASAVVPYSSFRTLLPTYWSPLLEQNDDLAVGIELSGEDVIERHSWAAQGLIYPEDGRLEGRAGYRYAGWGNPVLDLATGQRWSVAATGETRDGDLLRRTREGSASITMIRRRWDSSASVQLGADFTDVDFLRRGTLGDVERELPIDVGAFLGGGYSTARGFGLSLGLQEGFVTTARIQARRYLDAPADDADRRGFWRLTSRSRGYLALDWFGFAPPTLAARFDFGVESITSGPGFSLGGASGGSSVLPYQPSFLGRAIGYPVRGYDPGVQRGNRVASFTAEYRFPIALVERGVGVLPLALDRLTGDIFFDAGAAWCEGMCRTPSSRTPGSPEPIASVGVELVAKLRTGFFSELPFRFGVALPLEGGGASFYVRTVESF